MQVSKDGVKARASDQGYDFLVDNFSLSPREELTITYESITRPMKYGYLQVGLFEEGELGDDNF